MKNAHIYMQLLVGLEDKFGNKYSREDLKNLAKNYNFEGTEVLNNKDPELNKSALISQEMLGIWHEYKEKAVLFFSIVSIEENEYKQRIDQFRGMVDAILNELNQEAVYWFPAIRKPHEESFYNALLKPQEVKNAIELYMPNIDEIFGRQVFKTLTLIYGPEIDGEKSIVVYKSDWENAPMFIPNFNWIPPYADSQQIETVETSLRERYKELRDLDFQIKRNLKWRSSQTKPTGDILKREKYGRLVNYTFQFITFDSILSEAEKNFTFNDQKNRICLFKTYNDLVSDVSTYRENWDVLYVLNEHFYSKNFA